MSEQPRPTLRDRAGRMLRAALGDIRWRAPPWAGRLAAAAGSRTSAAAGFARRNPRTARAAAAAALALLAAAYTGWHWYESRPRPALTGIAVQPPGLTCYACQPQGKPNPLVVSFSRSAASLAERIDPAAGLIRMTPAMKGLWRWRNDRELAFEPAEDWPVGRHFEVRLARKGLLNPQTRLARYTFEFSSHGFEARIAAREFHQDPSIAADKKVVVSVSFTHPVDPALFEKRIALTLYEKVDDQRERQAGTPDFTVVYDKQRMNAYVHSSQLAMPAKLGRLAIRIAAGLRAARGGNQTPAPLAASVEVPGLNSLRVASISLQVARDERDEPSQALIVEMNRSVLERDMPRSVHAWLLPEKHPDTETQKVFERVRRGSAYQWTAEQVGADVLAASQPVALAHVPGELEHYEMHSFRHGAPPGRFLYVKVERGLRSFGGYVLESSVENVYQVPQFPREVRIAQQGSLLALSGSKALTVMTRGVPALHVEIGRLLPGRIQHLVTQADPTFTVPVFRNFGFDASDIVERFTSTLRLPVQDSGGAHYEALSLASYLANGGVDRRGIFLVTVQAWDPDRDAPLADGGRAAADQRLIVVTDLGLIEKKSLDGSRDVFVQSIHGGGPLGDVRIEILGRNGLAIMAATTDAEGHARFPDLKSFKREQEPVLYLARHDGDTSFLPMMQRDRRLDLSRFDVGGVEDRSDPGALSAYLFSDRGLYRPGEDIHLGAIVRTQDWKRTLEGVPLQLDILDPRGISVRSEAFVPGPAGFAEIRHATRDSSPAGTYTFSLSLVRPDRRLDLIGSTVVQVREFLPDRLRMSTRLSSESPAGWVSPHELKAAVALRNLFGTPAANRRVTALITLTPAFPAFPAFSEYHFHDPAGSKAALSFEQTLGERSTDERGEASFDLGLERFARATYRVHVATEGFEADGGRGVGAEVAQLVSAVPYLVGWRPDGNLDYVSRNARRAVTLIAVDPRAQATQVAGLTLSRLEVRYVSTLIRRNDGTFQYESRRKEVAAEKRALIVEQGGTPLALATESPGTFDYVLNDADGQEVARFEYHVAGNANLTRTLEKDAQLQIALSRADYRPGDEIEMQIQAPYVGRGLITIERDRVYAWKWFQAGSSSSTQRIRIPEGLAGNAYVHVELVRDPASEEIYASPLSYGVRPFSINLDARRDAVRLGVPGEVKPGETLTIDYATDRPARLLIFAVDEGILQVAGYRAPDPLGHFFQKRSLAVSTSQILELILPEIRNIDANAAAGGDRGGALARHLNPFRRKGEKAAAFWSGVLDSDSTRRQVQYLVPDYFNGTLRVMAVAVSDQAVGIAQSTSTVRGDFVLSPNAPTTVSPGDEFEVGVGVANNLGGSGRNAHLALTLHAGAGLEVIGPAARDLAIGENHEGAGSFRLRARDRLGNADLSFTVRSGERRVGRRIDLSIRPATPFMTSLAAGALKRGRGEVRIERRLYAEHRTLEASVSRVPLTLAHGLAAYLGNYPYACTEQIVSQAMPALLLAGRPEFGYVRAQPGADLEGLVNELRVRQNDEGAYRLWPGGSQVAEFASLYAQQFLLEAAGHGQRVPAGLIEAGNAHLKAIARRDGDNLEQERDSAYAIYLLTRQGLVMSAEAERLRTRLTERQRGRWEQDPTAMWLAGALRLMRQDREASSLAARLRFGAPTASSPYQDDLTRDAWLLYVLSRHFPERLADLPSWVLENIAARLDANVYHSLSAGVTLLALDAYVSATHADTPAGLALAQIGADGRAGELELPPGLMPNVSFSDRAVSLRFVNGADLPAFYLVDQSGFDRAPPREALSKGFEILREYTDAGGQPVPHVRMGDEIDVHIRFRATDARAWTEVALVDLLPGGFDLVVPRRGDAPEDDPSVTRLAADGDGDSSRDAREGAGTPGWGCGFCVRTLSSALRFSEPREDRVVFYAALTPDIQEIVYRIKATNAGRFMVPAAYGEAMYDRRIHARSATARIEVAAP